MDSFEIDSNIKLDNLVYPSHIGIIPDGNRRYALKKNKSAWWGHMKGYESLSDLISYFKDYDIHELSIYGFSTENLNRSINEKSNLFSIMELGLEKILDNNSDNIYNIKFPGNQNVLPEKLQRYIEDVESFTQFNSDKKLNICLGYGGRDELFYAFMNLHSGILNGIVRIDDLEANSISRYLYVENDVDLLIRTSEERLSNFLIWQSSYAEIIFLKNLQWPEFNKDIFDACLLEYSKRKRRFGK